MADVNFQKKFDKIKGIYPNHASVNIDDSKHKTQENEQQLKPSSSVP